MASGLDNIPQWKKDLILRKRAQNKYPSTDPSAVQLSCVSASTRSEVDSSKIGCEFGPNYRCGSGEVEVDKQYLQGDTTVPSQSETVNFVLVGRKPVSEQCSEKEGYSNNVISSVSNEDQFQVIQNTETVKMVRDTVLVMQASVTKNITNGECCVDKGAGEESDSSEELQYGPGIVNKLKSKYLSLTLRDTTTKARPTILNMRRATSLENMLDTDSADDDLLAEHNLNDSGGGDFEETSTDIMRVPLIAVATTTHPRRYISRVPNGERSTNNRNMQNRYRNTTRGNDSIKRARSVETLLRPTSSRESPNEDVVIISNKEGNNNSTSRKHRDNTKTTIQSGDAKSFSSYPSRQRLNRPKRVTPIMDETERPPADHVKQTLMLFEGPPVHRTKPPRPTGDVATKVANFKHIIEHDKQSNKSNVIKKPNVAIKPQISPRPVLSQTEKIRKTQSNSRSPSPKRPLTPSSSDERMNKEEIKLECTVPESVSSESISRSDHIPDISRIGEACDVSSLNVGRLRLSETPDLIVHSSPASSHVHSPTTIKHITTEFIKAELKCAEIINNKSSLRNEISRSPSPRPSQRNDIPSLRRKKTEEVDGDSAKEITKQAVENIGKAGTSVTYSFSDNANKSHLPRLNTVPVCITRLIPDTPSNKPTLVQQQHTVLKNSRPEVNGITTPDYTRTPSPLPSSLKEHHRAVPQLPKAEHSTTSSFVPSSANVLSPDGNKYVQPEVSKSTSMRPTAPVQNKTLTTREIEKNSINKLKTLEQPVSKVVVSVRNLDEVVVNKNLTGLLNKTSNKQNRTQEQTTILFNFQTRDSIPDYIATDGSSNVRRGKREKPKVCDVCFSFSWFCFIYI